MKIYNKIILDMCSNEVLYEDSFEYDGEVAECKSSGGGGGGDSTTTVRYAPYIEAKHSSFLDTVQAARKSIIGDGTSTAMTREEFVYVTWPDLAERWAALITGAVNTQYAEYLDTFTPGQLTGLSPFSNYTNIEVDTAFFGTGYLISSFPTLYDMFGKFIAGLDIDTLFSQIFEDTVNSPEVNDLVAAEGALIQDDVDEAVTAIEVGMRDINSVQASTFVIARAIPRDTKIKVLEKFRSELKYRLIPVATDRWKTHLEWNKGVIVTYAEIMKLYYASKMDITDFNYTMDVKDKLWPFTVLDYERACLGALQGATKTSSDVAGASTASKALSGAAVGAGVGAYIGAGTSVGGPWGAVIGGVVGLAAGLMS